MRGKLAIGAMVGIAFLMAGLGWWWNYHRSYRCRAFWGTEQLLAVRYPQQVEGRWLTGDSAWTDLTQAPGMSNAIDSLSKDANYEWASPVEAIKPQWVAEVRFRRQAVTTTMQFDFDHQLIGCAETGKVLVLYANTSRGWRSYLERRLPKQ